MFLSVIKIDPLLQKNQFIYLIAGRSCMQQAEGKAKNETEGDAGTLRCNLSKAQAVCERIRDYEQEVRGSICKAKGQVSIKSTPSPRP